MKAYAGIGSRLTPAPVRQKFSMMATLLEQLGYTLRSGGADGADTAFEAGVRDERNKQIFLPWQGFNNRISQFHNISPAAYEMAQRYHPAWNRCGAAAKKFHARNCYQILGYDLNDPVEFVVCWTPAGAVCGGTGQALRIAIDHKIPIRNFGSPELNLSGAILNLREMVARSLEESP